MALIQQDMGLLVSKQVVFTGKLSPLTFASNTGYNRYSLFERNPWDQTLDIFERYETFYDNGALTQDIRWGNKHFMDLVLMETIYPRLFI